MRLDHAVLADPAQQRPVDRRQPLLLDVCTQRPLDIADRSRAKIEIDQFGGTLAHPRGQIITRDHQVGTTMILTAHDDMRVGMAGVEVIDRDPVELRAEIVFHPRHQPPGQRLEVVIFRTVLGRDDEAELVAVAVPALAKLPAIDDIGVGAVQCTRLPLACRAVALEIAQVRRGTGQSFAGKLHDPRFDDDAALPVGGRTAAAGKHPPDPGATPNAAAAERPAARPRGGAATREIGRGEHAAQVGAGALAALVTKASKTGFELLVIGH